MSDVTKSGGPAFPQRTEARDTNGYITELADVDGMSLRDYFAAKAMQSLLGDYIPDRVIPEGPYAGKTERDVIADRAYDIADAMLKARSA